MTWILKDNKALVLGTRLGEDGNSLAGGGKSWAKVLRLEQYMVCLRNNEWTRLLKIEITKWQPTLKFNPKTRV